MQLALGAALAGVTAIAIQSLPSAAATPAGPGTARPQSTAQVADPAAPALVEPVGATVELFPTLEGGGRLDGLLERAGVDKGDSAKAAGLVSEALPAGIPDGTQVRILVGAATSEDERRLERLSFKPGAAFKVTIGRTVGGELKLVRDAVNVDARPQKFSGRAGSDLFWSLRAAGVPGPAAVEFIDAVAARGDVRAIDPDERFELVIDRIRADDGSSTTGPLLYAALDRRGANDLVLVRWTAGGETGLFDPREPNRRTAGLAKPVDGRISSTFGSRLHPILRFHRFHSGIDFAARRGSAVLAASDGVVAGAGWAGGYGRQVRLVHSGGVASSYSHLSGIAVSPGQQVRRGDLIGFVGSSGLSTGPHLHFEVRKNGRPVDPLGFSFAPPPLTSVEIAALRARADQLRAV